jgi:hypothetical protein
VTAISVPAMWPEMFFRAKPTLVIRYLDSKKIQFVLVKADSENIFIPGSLLQVKAACIVTGRLTADMKE